MMNVLIWVLPVLLLATPAAAEVITPGGNAPPTVTVATLPTCNTTTSKGMRRRVSDANATTHGSTVAGGGANLVLVECNGTNWTIDVPGSGGSSTATGTTATTFSIDSDNGGTSTADGAGLIVDGGSGQDVALVYESDYGGMVFNPPGEATFGGGLFFVNDPVEWPWLQLSPAAIGATTGTPTIKLCDPDADDEGDGCLELVQNCGNTTASAEDCETTFYQRSNGTRQAMVTIEGDELGDAIARTVFNAGVRFEHHIIIPNGSNPNLASAEMGRMTVDTTENQLLIANATATPLVFDERLQRDYSIQSPTARTLGFYKAFAAETIASINCITDTGTATLSLQECDATGASCAGVDGSTEIVCDSNNQADDGSLSNPTIDTGDWVKIVISGVASSPTDLAISVGYRMTRK